MNEDRREAGFIQFPHRKSNRDECNTVLADQDVIKSLNQLSAIASDFRTANAPRLSITTITWQSPT